MYEALFHVATRNFKKAAELFLESLSTFTTTELFSYKKFIFYTVLTAIIALDRVTLRKKARPLTPSLSLSLLLALCAGACPPRPSFSYPRVCPQVLHAPEILTVLSDIPSLSPLLNGLYSCKYSVRIPAATLPLRLCLRLLCCKRTRCTLCIAAIAETRGRSQQRVTLHAAAVIHILN